MEERVIDSIIKHLHELVPEVPCYCDESWQDDDRPSFYLYLINVIQSEMPFPHFFEVYSFDLVYDPRPSATPNTTARDMAGLLRVILRKFPDIEEGSHYGYNIESRTVDGLTHVTFDVRVEYELKMPEVPLIDDVNVEVKEKEYVSEK